MLLTVFLVLTILSTLSILPAYLLETTRFWGYMAIFGGIILLMTGILTNTGGVDVPTGTVVNETTAGYTSQTTFTNRQSTVFTAVGFGQILAGLAAVTITVRQQFMDEEDDSINDFSDDLGDGPVDAL